MEQCCTEVMVLLSKALHKNKCEPTFEKNSQQLKDTEDPVKVAAKIINKGLQKQISEYLLANKQVPYRFDEFNIDKLIEETDPRIWTFICDITKSISENRGTSKVNVPDSSAYYVKRIRKFFSICFLMFTIDDRCCMPLHTLITDAIDSYGGSTVLIRVLNRLGVCSSMDILSNSIKYRVSEREKLGVEIELNGNTLIIISADNIDFLHSFARIYCGMQTSSWHGTTIQAVQPKPSLALNACHTSGTKRGKPSPYPSPSKSCRSPAPKTQRRESEHSSEHTDNGHTSNSPTQQEPTGGIDSRKKLKLEQFKMTSPERAKLDSFQHNLLCYNIQKCHYLDKINSDKLISSFLDLHEYMSATKPVTVEQSNILYLQVLDAIADSKDTLIHILHDLEGRFIRQRHNLDFLLVEGDAKLYEVLQAIKFEYGQELLPMPGDWHLLKNFQIALMKPYFEAGLKELARVSGYPVASIQACGQFKRTHCFILEVWEALW